MALRACALNGGTRIRAVAAARKGIRRRRRSSNSRRKKTQVNAHASAHNEMAQLSAGLEAPIQLVYLGTLLALLGGATFLIARQVLIRRELDLAAKALGEKAREGVATNEELYELGCVLLRKRAYTQAVKYLESAQQNWDAGEGELAQVDNAVGYAYLQLGKAGPATRNFESAVQRQPGYVTALNNWGDALERAGQLSVALEKYEEAASYDPTNDVSTAKIRDLRNRVPRKPT